MKKNQNTQKDMDINDYKACYERLKSASKALIPLMHNQALEQMTIEINAIMANKDLSKQEKEKEIKKIMMSNSDHISLNIFMTRDVVFACQDALKQIKSHKTDNIQERLILSMMIEETNKLIESAKKELKKHKKFFARYENIMNR